MTARSVRLRVGLVHPYLWPAVRRGGERYLADLADYLVNAGHDLHVITGGDQRGIEHIDGYTVYRRPLWRGPARIGRRPTEVDLFGAPAYPTLRRARLDVVHALVPSAALAARLAGQRVVYTLLGHPSSEQLQQRPGGARLLRSAVRYTQAVTALSTSAASASCELFGHRPTVLPPGVRLDRFALDDRPRTGPPRVLYASDLGTQRKGLDVLLAAVARLVPDEPGMRLLLAGPGDPSWAFERLPAAQRSVVAEVTTVATAGSHEELTRYYRTASAVALPARDEAFGLVLVESLACGTPAVCCTGSGMSDIVTDDAVGRAVTYGDVAALAGALAATFGLAAEHGTPIACRRTATRFGWTEAVGPAHVQLYHQLRRRPGRSRLG